VEPSCNSKAATLPPKLPAPQDLAIGEADGIERFHAPGIQDVAYHPVAFRHDPCVMDACQRRSPKKSSNVLKGTGVDIGGRHLNLVCNGQGDPTVVFLQSLGGGITAWDKVRASVSAFTRTCFYDRAGFGYSDPATQPSSADNETNDLHALLKRAPVKRPIILVGHSLGGLYATLYADKFPDEVGGLVLVDPSSPNNSIMSCRERATLCWRTSMASWPF
jgi:alpha/beta hydrolase family protein